MKHIKKKFAFYQKKLPIKGNISLSIIDRRNNEALKDVDKKEKIAFMIDTDGYHTLATIYNNQGKELLVPIPDLTLVYYDSAYMNNYQRKSFENDLFKKLSQTSEITDNVSHETYRYINYATTSIIMMFTAIESFLNHSIPNNGIIPNDGKVFKKQKNRPENFNKIQIQRYIGFEDKIVKVIPYFTSKVFFENKGDFKISQIGKLKNLRDEIIHTKSSLLYQKHSELLKQLLDFEFDETLLAVKEYINSYMPNYIEDCPCNENF